ncbi:MAG: Crp/Fnr family transcriptional regulator [Bacteroidia bacterium]|nr:Crp/Fnr family transcriptional regulator [Bacteroidia bacterium]
MFSINLFTKYCSSEGKKLFEKKKQTLFFDEGQRIFHEGELVKGIYFIERGRVKVLSKSHDNSEKIIRLASNEMIVGHRGLNTKVYPISAETLSESVITFLPIEVFSSILKSNNEMAVYLINFLSDELRDSETRMKNLLILDPKTRIAIILVKLIDCFGYKKNAGNKLLNYTLSRTDIANMAGTTYETVIRTLAALKKERVIDLVGKEIAIINAKKLSQVAAGVKGKK